MQIDVDIDIHSSNLVVPWDRCEIWMAHIHRNVCTDFSSLSWFSCLISLIKSHLSERKTSKTSHYLFRCLSLPPRILFQGSYCVLSKLRFWRVSNCEQEENNTGNSLGRILLTHIYLWTTKKFPDLHNFHIEADLSILPSLAHNKRFGWKFWRTLSMKCVPASLSIDHYRNLQS